MRELQRASDGTTILRFAADFEQHCRGQAAALFGGVRFNSDVPYTQPVGFAPASIRYTSDPGDPIALGDTNSFVVLDGRTGTSGYLHNSVGLELQMPSGQPNWILEFSAPNEDALRQVRTEALHSHAPHRASRTGDLERRRDVRRQHCQLPHLRDRMVGYDE